MSTLPDPADIGSLLVFVMPAWISNATPAAVVRHLPRTHPIDGGRCFSNGRRVLGDGKTVEGFVLGVAAGTLAGLALSSIGLHDVASSFLLALGAMVGDAAGSFVKRRLGYERGAHAWGLDELPFLYFALLLYFARAGSPSLRDLQAVAVLSAITFVAHNVTNYAHRLLLEKLGGRGS